MCIYMGVHTQMHACTHTHTMLYLLIIVQQQVDWHVLIGCFKVRLARQLHPLSLKYKGLSACVCAPKHSFWTHLMVSLNKGTFFNLAASFWPKNNFHLFSSSRLHQVFYYCVFLSRWFRADLEWRDRHFLTVFDCISYWTAPSPDFSWELKNHQFLLPKSHK